MPINTSTNKLKHAFCYIKCRVLIIPSYRRFNFSLDAEQIDFCCYFTSVLSIFELPYPLWTWAIPVVQKFLYRVDLTKICIFAISPDHVLPSI